VDSSGNVDVVEIAAVVAGSLSEKMAMRYGQRWLDKLDINHDKKTECADFEAFFEKHLTEHGEEETLGLLLWFEDLSKKVTEKRASDGQYTGPLAPATTSAEHAVTATAESGGPAVEIAVTSDYNKKVIFEAFAVTDANSDGTIDAKEIAALLANSPLSQAAAAKEGVEWFERFNSDGDRKVDPVEFEAFFEKHLAENGEGENNALVDWFAELAKELTERRKGPTAAAT